MPLSIGTPEYIFEAAMSTMLLEARRVICLSACGHLLGGSILMIIEHIELMNVVHMGHHMFT